MKPLIVLCLFLVIGLFSSLLPPNLPITAGLLIGVLTGVVLGLVFGAQDYLRGRERYRKNMRTPGESYIGRGGVYMQGHYVPVPRWCRLSPVMPKPGESAILRLKVERNLFRRRMVIAQVQVPIPQGKEEEAREVAKRLADAA